MGWCGVGRVLVLVILSVCACGSTPHSLSLAPSISPQKLLMLRQFVLEGIGLSRLPDVSNMNITESEYAAKYEVYLKTMRENRRLRLQRDTYLTSQRFYSIAHFGASSHVQQYKGPYELLFFPVGQRNATVDQATLRLFVLAPLQGSQPQPHIPALVTLRVYLVQLQAATTRTLLDSRTLRLHNSSRWAELDVGAAVQGWLSGTARNMGLEVECEGCYESGVRVLGGTQPEASSFTPVLNMLLTEREEYPRSPRAMEDEAVRYDDSLGSDCRKGPNHGRCCRHSMEVVFKDVPGFEFILQPHKFNAGFCKGRCPARYHPASQHALLQSLVYQSHRAPRPCCAPHLLADIEVLHLDETDPSTLKVSTWKGMQVQKCACS